MVIVFFSADDDDEIVPCHSRLVSQWGSRYVPILSKQDWSLTEPACTVVDLLKLSVMPSPGSILSSLLSGGLMNCCNQSLLPMEEYCLPITTSDGHRPQGGNCSHGQTGPLPDCPREPGMGTSDSWCATSSSSRNFTPHQKYSFILVEGKEPFWKFHISHFPYDIIELFRSVTSCRSMLVLRHLTYWNCFGSGCCLHGCLFSGERNKPCPRIPVFRDDSGDDSLPRGSTVYTATVEFWVLLPARVCSSDGDSHLPATDFASLLCEMASSHPHG